MINTNRTIENVWTMLQNLYDELKTKKFKDIDITNIETIDNLYALIIARWCAAIAKEGLYKEYVEIENEELTSPKGQINVQESIVRQTQSHGMLVCSYDELSDDIYINHILKGALYYWLHREEVDQPLKIEIKKTLMLFNSVSNIDITLVHWKDIKFNNNNVRYKHLIEIIKDVVYEHKLVMQGILDDNKRVYVLFKKQIFKLIKQKYCETETVEVFDMAFDLEIDQLFEIKTNKKQKFIAIRGEKKALLFYIRLQDEQVIGDTTVGRRHIHYLVGALREYYNEYKVKPSGCILYINTDSSKYNIKPINITTVGDFIVGEQIIDIHDYWRFIVNKIDDCYKYFILRGKSDINKKKK